MLSEIRSLDPPEPLTRDVTTGEDGPTDVAGSLVSLAFIRTAIRRSRRFWCATAFAGMLIGLAPYVVLPAAQQASTSVLLTYGPYEEDATTGVFDNVAIAQSRAVAGFAVHQLRLKESASDLLASYKVAVISNRVLQITVTAPSSEDAVRRANVIASAFLSFRGQQLQAQQNLEDASLEQEISDARQKVSSIGKQISDLSTQSASPAQQAQLAKLQAEHDKAANELTTLEQSAGHGGTATTMAVKGSHVLDTAVPVAQSRLHRLFLYPFAGLILGFVVGIVVIVLRALLSDRLHHRDEVAHALGVPVRVSVGTGRSRRRIPVMGRKAAARDRDIQLVVEQLRNAVPPDTPETAALAVVAVDDPQVASQSVVSLAVSCAQAGKHVVVVDLCGGAPAGKLLGVATSGVHEVTVNDTQLVAAVPDQGEVAPVGPLERPWRHDQRSSFGEAAHAAYASADLVLTVATVDPSLGGEHLATWATDAVAVVTAGKSSVTRVHTVGQMIRLAGVRLVCAVLVGAEKNDDTLGIVVEPEASFVPDFP